MTETSNSIPTPITSGRSGAAVFAIGSTRILKTVRRAELADPSLFETFRREAAFYQFARKNGFHFTPEILSIEETPDKITILMKQYQPIPPEAADNTLLPRLAQTLVEIHTAPVPDFLPKADCAPFSINDSDRQSCKSGWLSIADEHASILWNGRTAAEIIRKIAADINKINRYTFKAHFTLNHGDFHLENCLMDEEKRLIICDWQNVSVGNPAGDLSFFLSRLGADGTALPKDQFIDLYCEKYAERLPDVNPKQYRTELEKAMLLAELNTSFLFWHQYLHGAAEDRVMRVFGKMAEAWQILSEIF